MLSKWEEILFTSEMETRRKRRRIKRRWEHSSEMADHHCYQRNDNIFGTVATYAL